MLKNKNENKLRFLNDYLINGIAGLCGNLASGILYPLELIKLRLQGKFLITCYEPIQIYLIFLISSNK